ELRSGIAPLVAAITGGFSDAFHAIEAGLIGIYSFYSNIWSRLASAVISGRGGKSDKGPGFFDSIKAANRQAESDMDSYILSLEEKRLKNENARKNALGRGRGGIEEEARLEGSKKLQSLKETLFKKKEANDLAALA